MGWTLILVYLFWKLSKFHNLYQFFPFYINMSRTRHNIFQQKRTFLTNSRRLMLLLSALLSHFNVLKILILIWFIKMNKNINIVGYIVIFFCDNSLHCICFSGNFLTFEQLQSFVCLANFYLFCLRWHESVSFISKRSVGSTRLL